MTTRTTLVVRSVSIAAALALLWGLAGAGGSPDVVTKTFAESDEVLTNPDCGWIAYNYEDSYAMWREKFGGKEPFPLASVIYTRHVRKAWEDENGNFEHSAPLKLIEDWMANGRNVGFRIYANSTKDLPSHLRAKVDKVILRKGLGIQYWDEDYIEDHRKLVTFLGERLGNSDRLAFVDIGAVGNSGGEWYFEPREPFEDAGLNDYRSFEMVTTFAEMYRKAFPKTRLFISYECATHAGRYKWNVISTLTESKIGIRDDGLGGWPFPSQSPSLEKWPVPMFWLKVPVLFEGSGHPGGVYGWHKRGKKPGKILNWAFAKAPPSYINMGGTEMASARASNELAPLLEKYGRRLGYRFALLKASYPTFVKRGGSLELDMVWANRGVAPCYADRKLQVSLYDDKGKVIKAVAAGPEPPTTEWAPGAEKDVHAQFPLLDDVATGKYALKLGVLLGHAASSDRCLMLGNKDTDASHRIALGTLVITD